MPRATRKTAGRDKGAPRPSHNAGGRPVFQPTDEQRRVVRLMVAGGIQQREIAPAIGIDRTTLIKHFRDDLDHGLLRANTQVVGHLFGMTKTNVRAAEFWLTNRDSARWTNTMKIDQRLQISDERPDFSRLSMEQLAKVREVAAMLRQAKAAPQIEGHAMEVTQDNDEGDDE